MNIECPECKNLDFEQDPVDPQYYICRNCGIEVMAHRETDGFLTKYQKKILGEVDEHGGEPK